MLKRTTFGGMTLALLAGLFGPQSWAQTIDPTFPINGTHDKHLVATVLEHATVHVDHETVVEDGTVVMHQGRIVAMGPSATTTVREPSVRLDMTGLHLYPSFVDLHSGFGTPKVQSAGWSRSPQDLSDKKGAFGWNEAVRPETEASAAFDPESEMATSRTPRESSPIISRSRSCNLKSASGTNDDELLTRVRRECDQRNI